jgi:hypothetical protein
MIAMEAQAAAAIKSAHLVEVPMVLIAAGS